MNEAAVQTAIRIRAGELGIPLCRNNSGACVDSTGRMIRYGLANDSAQMSKRIKSGDLIGMLPHKFGEEFDGPSALFISVECKRSDWHADPARFNEREQAQQNWIDFVREHGGVAGFCRSVAEFEQLIGFK